MKHWCNRVLTGGQDEVRACGFLDAEEGIGESLEAGYLSFSRRIPERSAVGYIVGGPNPDRENEVCVCCLYDLYKKNMNPP